MDDDFRLYQEEENKYQGLVTSLFYYQKHKDDPWSKGENFGDYLSKVIVAEVAMLHKMKQMKKRDAKLLAIGSILHFANDGDVVWGSGINGKILFEKHKFTTLDIRSLRGPLTKKLLEEEKNLKIGELFGDPALLLPTLFPHLKYKPIKNKITWIPNLNEYEMCAKIMPSSCHLISPLLHWSKVVNEILTSDIVLTSSLHGLIVSEAFGVPVRLFKPFGGETMFKYEDYLEGTGRTLYRMPKSFLDTMACNEGVSFSSPCFNESSLLEAFPCDLFTKGES